MKFDHNGGKKSEREKEKMIVKRRKLNETVFDDIPYDCWGVIIKFCNVKEFLQLMRVQKKLLEWIKKNPWLIKDMVFTLSKKFNGSNYKFPFKFIGWIFENVRSVKFTVSKKRFINYSSRSTLLTVSVNEYSYLKKIFGEKKREFDVKIGVMCPLNTRHVIPLNSDCVNVFDVPGFWSQYGCQECYDSFVFCECCDEKTLCDDKGLCEDCNDRVNCIECGEWFIVDYDETTEDECKQCTECQCEHCCDTQMRKKFHELNCVDCGNKFEICESCRLDRILCVTLCKHCSLKRLSNNIAQKKKLSV